MTHRATIVGVGLMGGSLGLALRRRGWRVTGVGRNAARLQKARARGALTDLTTSVADGVREADVVVLAAPVKDLIPLARRAWPHLKPGALMTDVGSVKGPLVKAAAGWRGAADFVGAHPMCGSEKTGAENARADLYKGAPCVLTPAPRTSRSALERAKRFWSSVGARPVVMDAAAHDRAAARVSHLPHLIAEALVSTAERGDEPLAAGSFRDATRVAGADPELWAQIFSFNRPAVRAAAAAFQRNLSLLIKGGPTAAALKRIRRRREKMAGARA